MPELVVILDFESPISNPGAHFRIVEDVVAHGAVYDPHLDYSIHRLFNLSEYFIFSNPGFWHVYSPQQVLYIRVLYDHLVVDFVNILSVLFCLCNEA